MDGRPKQLPTLCGECGLYYLYPKDLDYERNPCPRCGHGNNDGKGMILSHLDAGESN